MKQFPEFYKSLDPRGQQLVLGSVLDEKLVFENNDYRTIKFVKVIQRIAAINKCVCRKIKMGLLNFFLKSPIR